MPSPSELDVLNVKALLLLQSDKPDSADTLRTLLMDTITHKYGATRNVKPIPPISEPRPETVTISSGIEETNNPVNKSDTKIDSPPRSPHLTICLSDDSDDGLEILEGKCSVCNGEKFYSKSILIECSECHTLYHKECHNPPVTEDLSDPRVVWYCRTCNDSMNKTVETTNSKPTSTKTSSSKESKSSKTNDNLKESSTSGKSSSNKSSSDKRLQNIKKRSTRK